MNEKVKDVYLAVCRLQLFPGRIDQQDTAIDFIVQRNNMLRLGSVHYASTATDLM